MFDCGLHRVAPSEGAKHLRLRFPGVQFETGATDHTPCRMKQWVPPSSTLFAGQQIWLSTSGFSPLPDGLSPMCGTRLSGVALLRQTLVQMITPPSRTDRDAVSSSPREWGLSD
jgi:hypothetical protein